MIKITIDKKTYKVPTLFKELNIATYQELNRIEEKDEIKKLITYLNVLTGIDEKIIRKIELEDLKKLTDNLLVYFNKTEYELVKAVDVKGKVYVFDYNLSNMRFDQYIDLEEMTKDTDLIIENLHLIMAILYRPAKKKRFYQRKLKIEEYDSETVRERADFFKKNMMMDKVFGALFFFTNLRAKYITTLEDFLEEQKKQSEQI